MLVLLIIYFILVSNCLATNKIEHYNEYVSSQLNTNINKTFPVYSAIKWNPSAFHIREQLSYKIVVDHVGVWFDGGIATSYVGYKSWFDSVSNCYVGQGMCRAHLRFKRRFSEGNWFALVCAVGTYLQPVILPNIGTYLDTRFLPFDETEFIGKYFVITKVETIITSKWSGELVCFANDAHNLYWNNKGYINVTISAT